MQVFSRCRDVCLSFDMQYHFGLHSVVVSHVCFVVEIRQQIACLNRADMSFNIGDFV